MPRRRLVSVIFARCRWPNAATTCTTTNRTSLPGSSRVILLSKESANASTPTCIATPPPPTEPSRPPGGAPRPRQRCRSAGAHRPRRAARHRRGGARQADLGLRFVPGSRSPCRGSTRPPHRRSRVDPANEALAAGLAKGAAAATGGRCAWRRAGADRHPRGLRGRPALRRQPGPGERAHFCPLPGGGRRREERP